MRKRVLPLLWCLALLTLAANLYLWGGLAVTPRIGNRLIEQSSLQDPLATTYLQFGRLAVQISGTEDAARRHAATRFSSLYPELKLDEYTMLRRLLAAQPALVTLSYHATPWLLLLSLALHLLTSPFVKTFSKKRR